MKGVPKIKLSEFFRQFPPTHVFGTTYTVSLAFFESVVFPEIKPAVLKRCVILCDRTGFQRAIQEGVALRGATHEYCIVVPPGNRTLHAKVWLMVGEDQASLLVGSGNLTQAGFIENVELFETVSLGDDQESAAQAFGDLGGFLDSLIALWKDIPSKSIPAVAALEETRDALGSLLTKRKTFDQSIRFLSSFSGSFPSQFPKVSDKATIFIAAPYFGSSTQAVERLAQELPAKSFEIFPAVHSGDALDVPLNALKKLPKVRVNSLSVGDENSGFVHLKLYGAKDPGGSSWLFCGSPNCTTAALFGQNIEAGILRNVSSDELEDYFSPESGEKLPTSLVNFDRPTDTGWIPFWASDLGQSIEIVLGNFSSLPLTGVELSLSIGTRTDRISIDRMFADGGVERVLWSTFYEGEKLRDATPVLRLRAKDTSGKAIQGAAFVDDVWMLSSTSEHRSAFRGALSLLSSGGLPMYGDIAAIFSLSDEIFDFDGDSSGEEANTTVKSESASKISQIDKVPLWPPQAIDSSIPTPGGTKGIGGIQVCQAILAAFLKRDFKQSATNTSDSAEPDAADDEESEDTAPTKTFVSNCEGIWSEAEQAFDTMEMRLRELVCDERHSTNLWSFSIFIFLITLSVKRSVSQASKGAVPVPTNNDLVRRYISLMFSGRSQDEDFCLTVDCRYKRLPFPALALDLSEFFDKKPHSDIVPILMIAFCYLKAITVKAGTKTFPLLEFLHFRDVTRSNDAAEAQSLDTLKQVYESYFFDSRDGITWSEIDKARLEVSQLDWPSHPAFRDLEIITGLISNQTNPNVEALSAHLKSALPLLERRLRRERTPPIAMEDGVFHCVAKGCSKAHQNTPDKRPLRSGMLVICEGCGAVLAPNRLMQKFQEYKRV